MQVMENIRDVRKTSEETKDMFEPLQKILTTLKAHGFDITALPKIGDDSMPMQDYLDESPLLWDSVEKKMFRKKEDIMPLQLREVDLLKGSWRNSTLTYGNSATNLGRRHCLFSLAPPTRPTL